MLVQMKVGGRSGGMPIHPLLVGALRQRTSNIHKSEKGTADSPNPKKQKITGFGSPCSHAWIWWRSVIEADARI